MKLPYHRPRRRWWLEVTAACVRLRECAARVHLRRVVQPPLYVEDGARQGEPTETETVWRQWRHVGMKNAER